jgi:hypothetical protein
MTLMLGAALVLILCGGVAAVFIAIMLFAGQDGPQEAPTWTGPTAQQVEAAVRSAIERDREAPLQPHPGVVELARHHAFDMAVRGFADERDPEGIDLAGRRLRLHPTFVGHLRQWVHVREASASSEPALLAAALLEGCGDITALQATDWNVLGVGVAMERGRLSCCLVAGAWWATLDEQILGGLPPSGWSVEGMVEEGTGVEQLAVREVDSGDAPRPAEAVPDAAARFQLRVDASPGCGARVVVVREGVEGVPRPI